MATGLAALGHSVVRVLAADGAYAGLGYRVAPDLVITCAHVVAAALGTDPQDPSPPAGEVRLDTPLASGAGTDVQISAAPVPGGWLPVAANGAPADLALLRVAGTGFPLPGTPAGLDPGISHTGKPFAAYGGPDGHQRHLILLEGRVRALVGSGRWQLSVRDSDYPIEPGCSGAPAIDTRTGLVIGLIAQDERDPAIRAGFLIPAAHLRALLAAAGLSRPAIPGLQPLRDWLDGHLGRILPVLADPVRRFVDYYAGAPDRPMPFAGRDDALAELDRRLADGGGVFQLISGAAGLGKSALLLHWTARRLREDADLRLLFLPISIRFDTAEERTGLRLLHAQLAGLFAEVAFPEGMKPDQEDYRDRIAAGWQAIAERPGERFQAAIRETAQAIRDVSRWWP
ncbi:serine protease [Thiohalocapsa sp. ML1]|uniref:S1 family peptidase n=1 Tax=Thiohalocapsa sp. ML1 TaxID=1431688 RepID=UPI0007323700|nr:serine protease [Thiohalocapsa sp. ML1]